MRKKLMLLVACAVFVMLTLPSTVMGQNTQNADNVGIGFEFGTNYIMDADGEEGASNVFILDFALSEVLSVGLYRENVDGDIQGGPINAVQVKHNVVDMLDTGVRFGDFDGGNLYAGVFGSFTPLSTTSETFNGALKLNLGYDFIPDVEDLIKVGISAVISF